MKQSTNPPPAAASTLVTKQFYNRIVTLDRSSGYVVIKNAGDGTSYQTDLSQVLSGLGESIELLYSVESTSYTLRKLLETYSESGGDFNELMVSGLAGMLAEITSKVGEEAIAASHRLEILGMLTESMVGVQHG